MPIMTTPPTAKLDYQQVRQAALSLTAAGTTPTLQSMRDHLDYRGDTQALAALLQDWQQDLRDAPEAALPDQVPSEISQALAQVWQLAKSSAGNGYAELRRQADTEIANATAHRVEALAGLKREQVRSDELETSLAASRDHAAALERKLAAYEERLGANDCRQTELLEQAETMRIEHRAAAAEAASRVEQAKLAAAERDQQHAITTTEQLARIKHLERQVAEQEQSLSTLRQQHRQAHDLIAQHAVSLKERDRLYKDTTLERDKLLHRIEQQQNQLGRNQADRDGMRERQAQLLNDNKTQQVELEQARQHTHRLDLGYAQAKQEIAALTEQLNKLLEAGRPSAPQPHQSNPH